ncbi:NADP-dependent oxidoreductase [Microbacterium sp. PMB16]|uniref:NADP-dependent oxidoreductase n=1 Tax=Microbacterium sp. PMB16 TaxID=3120157 RepID=UPI003F4B7355
MADTHMTDTTAVRFDRFGEITELALQTVEQSPLAPHQVRVRIAVAGLNPVDWQIVESETLAKVFGITAPSGYGNDFAGVIAETGSEVVRWRVGDRVFGGARGAAVATSVVLDEKHRSLHRTPDGISDLTAGVIDIAGRTASAVADALAVREGELVLVGAAGGGVGSILTQLLVRSGARVIGTGSAASAEYITSLGAQPIEYGAQLEDALRASADGPIAAAADLHGVQTALTALALGVPAARIVTIESEEPPSGVIAVNGSDATPDALPRLLELVAADELTVPIESVYTLRDFRQAIERQRSRHVRGKVAIDTSVA